MSWIYRAIAPGSKFCKREIPPYAESTPLKKLDNFTSFVPILEPSGRLGKELRPAITGQDTMMIRIEEFNKLVNPLLGMPVSRPWRGYGSALFLELGSLHPPRNPRLRGPFGESCIMLEWEWRIESNNSVIFGSSNSAPSIENHLSLLRDLRINAISLDGELPELKINFSNGFRLRSMVMISGDPQWGVKLPDGSWMSCRNGSIVVSPEDEPGEGLCAEEEEIMELADRASKRWGAPLSEPKQGDCRECKYFVHIDGDFALLDYGVCVELRSPFDGRVVNVGSGCPSFSPM